MLRIESWVFKLIHFISVPLLFIALIFYSSRWLFIAAIVNIILFILNIVFRLFRSESEIDSVKSEEMIQANFSKKSNGYHFRLCSEISIKYALENIRILTEYNKNRDSVYGSYKALSCSKEELKRSFYFLKDSSIFCSRFKFYNSIEFAENVSTLHFLTNSFYFDIDPNLIPNDEDVINGFKLSLSPNEDLDSIELEDLKLITWRKKTHWQYWANKYDIKSKLGKYCLERSNSVT